MAKNKEPTDINEARMKRLPQQQYIDVQFDDPACWLQQVVDHGTPVPGVTGVHFGLGDVPGVIISAEQCMAFADALMKVAKHLDPDAYASWVGERKE